MRCSRTRSRASLCGLALWLAVLTPARLLRAEPAPQATTLSVPFLPQTDALCGGAAAAMVFRYWGDRHADVQQFATLVDRRAGGIADTVLVDAIKARGWRTERLDAGLDGVRARLARGQPVIVLLEERSSRYHFVVAVGADADGITVHDPTWGPARRHSVDAFLAKWKATGYWALAVQPVDGTVPDSAAGRKADRSGGETLRDDSRRPAPTETGRTDRVAAAPAAGKSATCERAMDEAVAAVGVRGLDAADELFATATVQCPESSRPTSELAGVRFAQRRFTEASALAERAVAIDRTDGYAWNVLASSRFVRDDLEGAIRAWNIIERPTVDSVAIEGLTRTRHAAFARMLPFEPNTRLTSDDFALAARRVRELPGITGSRLSFTPDDDGWATVRVAVVERRIRPRGIASWTLAGARASATRELTVTAPGWNGEGEVWGGSWRWWPERPRVTIALTMPRVDPAGGVWRVDGSWMAQRYEIGRAFRPADFDATQALGEPVREARFLGALSWSNWATPQLRYEVSAGLGAWNGARRAAGVGLEVDRRFAHDRFHLSGGGRTWRAIGAGGTTINAVADGGRAHFSSASVRAMLRAPDQNRRWAGHAIVGAGVASDRAPFSEWPAPGDADPRSPLLRAHGLTRRGIVDNPAFGRRLAFASVEGRGWFPQPTLVGLGLAAFVDAAQAWRRDASAGPGSGVVEKANATGPLLVDAGVGLRLRWPGRDAVLRLDYGHGLSDGRNAVSIGWVLE